MPIDTAWYEHPGYPNHHHEIGFRYRSIKCLYVINLFTLVVMPACLFLFISPLLSSTLYEWNYYFFTYLTRYIAYTWISIKVSPMDYYLHYHSTSSTRFHHVVEQLILIDMISSLAEAFNSISTWSRLYTINYNTN